MPIAAGTVAELHRWPLKSAGGEPVDALRIDPRGAGGDRTYALFDGFKGRPRRLTAREAPRLLAWSAGYGGADVDPADPPAPALVAPDGREHGWDDADTAAVLAEDLGKDVELRRDVRGQQDLPNTLLLTTQATLDALREELGDGLDLRRFRTNVHAVLDAAAWAEHDWQGARLRIGEAELEALHPCLRCVIPTRDPDTQAKMPRLLRHLTRAHGGHFGLNVRPLGPATIRVGDRVEVSAR
jgi:uncharacterized protein YcbX